MLPFWRIKKLWWRTALMVGLLIGFGVRPSGYMGPVHDGSVLALLGYNYSLNFAFYVPLILFIGTTVLITDYWITALHSGLAHLVIERRSKTWLLGQMLLTTFLYTFLMLTTALVGTVVAIRVIYPTLPLASRLGMMFFLFDDPTIGLIVYILTHAAGYALMADFVLMIGLWIKRPFLFRASGLVISFTLYLGLGFVSSVPLTRQFFGHLYLPNLIDLQQQVGYGRYGMSTAPLTPFFFTVLLYAGLIIAGSWAWLKFGGEGHG